MCCTSANSSHINPSDRDKVPDYSHQDDSQDGAVGLPICEPLHAVANGLRTIDFLWDQDGEGDGDANDEEGGDGLPGGSQQTPGA